MYFQSNAVKLTTDRVCVICRWEIRGSQELCEHQVEMDFQEIHTTNINACYESTISHPMPIVEHLPQKMLWKHLLFEGAVLLLGLFG